MQNSTSYMGAYSEIQGNPFLKPATNYEANISYILKGNLKILYTPSDEDKIAEVFTENNQMAIVYNNKDEETVSKYLKELEEVELIKVDKQNIFVYDVLS